MANQSMGMRIRECRIRKGLTQEKLAESLCCKKSLISQYENNKVDIKGSVIVELASLLGTTAGYLLNGELGCNLDENEKEMLSLMRMINNPSIAKVALEQVKLLMNIS